jgi:uncharacterized protein (TIRG00374 family)
MKRKLAHLWRWVRPLSGVAGLVVLLKLVDGAAVAAAFKGVNPIFLLLAALLVLLVTALRARRWAFLFRQREINVPSRRLLSTNLIGSFYGQFLPTSSAVGATLLFAEAARYGGSTVDFIATILVERVLNLVSLFATASIVVLVARPAGLPAGLTATIHLTAIGLGVGLLLLRWGWGLSGLGRLLARLRLQKLSQHLDTLSQALQSDLGRSGVIGRGLALSALINTSVTAVSYLVTLAVAGPVPPLSFMAMATLIVTLQGIPITPGSLGVRESLYVFFLGLLGVGEPQAFTVGLFVMVLHWLQGFIGGLVLLQRSLPKAGVRRGFARINTALFSQHGRIFGGVRWLWSVSKRLSQAS